MIYFLSALLAMVIALGKAHDRNGALLMFAIIVSLLLAILRVGGWL